MASLSFCLCFAVPQISGVVLKEPGMLHPTSARIRLSFPTYSGFSFVLLRPLGHINSSNDKPFLLLMNRDCMVGHDTTRLALNDKPWLAGLVPRSSQVKLFRPTASIFSEVACLLLLVFVFPDPKFSIEVASSK